MFNYTLVVPPWAFPEESAYNIQVLGLPLHRSTDDAFLYQKLLNLLLHDGHTIYYGSEYYRTKRSRVVNRQGQLERWESSAPNAFVGATFCWMFLAPPTDVYRWNRYEDRSDARLGRVIETSERELTLELYFAGVDQRYHTHPDTTRFDSTGPNIYYVFQDDKLIENFLLEPGKFSMFEVEYERDNAYTKPLDVELPENGRSVFHVVAVPRPFGLPYEHEFPRGENRAGSSNQLILEHVPN